jgi:hypothetical protein
MRSILPEENGIVTRRAQEEGWIVLLQTDHHSQEKSKTESTFVHVTFLLQNGIVIGVESVEH